MKYLIGFIIGAALLGGGLYIGTEQKNDEHTHSDEHHDEDDHQHEQALVAKEPVRADGSFTISTSFYPLQFALERIAGDNAEVINIGAGRDPHDFRPSTQAIRILQSSDLVVLQGANFEPWGEEVAAQLHTSGIPILFTTAALDLSEHTDDEHSDEHADEGHADIEHKDDNHHEDEEGAHHDDAHEHGQFDPHTWLDPVLYSETVAQLADALATLDPEFAAVYAANAATLQAELTELDTAYQTRLSNCQYEEAIISHDAFGYLAARYDLILHPIAGLSTQDTPSARTLANLREEAADGVGAILLEESSITAYGDTLARETGLSTLSINPVAFTVPEGSDYFTLMNDNLDTLVTAFACHETN